MTSLYLSHTHLPWLSFALLVIRCNFSNGRPQPANASQLKTSVRINDEKLTDQGSDAPAVSIANHEQDKEVEARI